VEKHVRVAILAFGFATLALAPQTAKAHFVLEEPPSWMSQDSLGLPQKLGPCGDEYDGTDAAAPTGTVTTVQEGSTITVTIHEVVFHPGHYRIAIAPDRASLPPEPPVTPADTPCGSAPVQNPPVFPVLADGVFDHSAAFTAPQTTTVTLPAGFTCTKCTLQVIEFMGSHPLNNPGGCFYHHCADFSVVAKSDAGRTEAGAPAAEAGQGSASGTGSSAGSGSSPGSASGSGGTAGGSPGPATGNSGGGCGCHLQSSPSGAGGAVPMLAVVALLVRSRRRRNA
jgi:MYXO-CTERM domain-containing protein